MSRHLYEMFTLNDSHLPGKRPLRYLGTSPCGWKALWIRQWRFIIKDKPSYVCWVGLGWQVFGTFLDHLRTLGLGDMKENWCLFRMQKSTSNWLTQRNQYKTLKMLRPCPWAFQRCEQWCEEREEAAPSLLEQLRAGPDHQTRSWKVKTYFGLKVCISDVIPGWGWCFSHLELRAGDPGVLLDRAILSSSSLKDQLLLFQVIIQDEVWFILPPMDGVAQVNALKGSGWLLLPSPPIRRPSISPLAVSTLLSPPLKGAPNREAPSYRAHSWASSKNRPISGSKVNIQVALNSFEALKFVLGKTPRSVYEYWAVFQT